MSGFCQLASVFGISFLFMAELCSAVWAYHSLFIPHPLKEILVLCGLLWAGLWCTHSWTSVCGNSCLRPCRRRLLEADLCKNVASRAPNLPHVLLGCVRITCGQEIYRPGGWTGLQVLDLSKVILTMNQNWKIAGSQFLPRCSGKSDITHIEPPGKEDSKNQRGFDLLSCTR